MNVLVRTKKQNAASPIRALVRRRSAGHGRRATGGCQVGFFPVRTGETKLSKVTRSIVANHRSDTVRTEIANRLTDARRKNTFAALVRKFRLKCIRMPIGV
jgi:hypothetical protein